MTIREAILRLVLPLIKKQVRVGKAVNVDKDKCLCDVDLGGDLMLYDVSLKAIEGGKEVGLVTFPKDKSYVLATMVEGIDARWAITHYSEIESWGIYTEKGKIEILKDSGEVHLNGDSKGAMVVIQSLVDKLNRLEQKHNALVTDFNTHLHTNGNMGANTGTPVATSSSSIAPVTSVNDLKNDKVKHGA